MKKARPKSNAFELYAGGDNLEREYNDYLQLTRKYLRKSKFTDDEKEQAKAVAQELMGGRKDESERVNEHNHEMGRN